jgi:hypothetical protein
MEAIMELILGKFALHVWVSAAEITDDLILELDDILGTQDTSVDLKHHVLQLDQEVSLYTTVIDVLPS